MLEALEGKENRGVVQASVVVMESEVTTAMEAPRREEQRADDKERNAPADPVLDCP